MDQAIKHCEAGLGIWEWASNDRGEEPDVVMACCGDVPTLETLAAVKLIRRHAPELKVRVINIVDLMTLQPPTEHPHGLSDRNFNALFTTDKPIIFAFHGYPWLIHRLTYRRAGHGNLHVRGYKEEGTTSTPFDMCVLNELDRFHLVLDAIDRVPKLSVRAAYGKQAIRDKLIEHREYITKHGDDTPEIAGWTWGQGTSVLLALGRRKIVRGLQVQPKTQIDAEVAAEPKGRRRATPANDVADSPVNADRLRERARRQAQAAWLVHGVSRKRPRRGSWRAQAWRWSSLRAYPAGLPSAAAIQGREREGRSRR